jgi:hypothetical protein
MPWYAIVALAISSIITVASLFGVFWAGFRNKYSTATDNNYLKTIESYKEVVTGQNAKISSQSDEIKQLRLDHSESMKEIGKLQGELKSYKELPLKELSENLKIVTQLSTLIAAHLKIDGLDKIGVITKES